MKRCIAYQSPSLRVYRRIRGYVRSDARLSSRVIRAIITRGASDVGIEIECLSFLKTPSGRCPGGIIPENPIWHRFPPRRRVRDHRRGRDRRSMSARAGQMGVSPI